MGQELLCGVCMDDDRRAHKKTEPFIASKITGGGNPKTEDKSPPIAPLEPIESYQTQMPPLMCQDHAATIDADILYGREEDVFTDDRILHMDHPTTSMSNSRASSLYTDEIRNMIDVQQQTLDDMELKQLSIDFLRTQDANGGTFITFVSKYLNAMIMSKMWTKLDDNDSGYIETAEDICAAIVFINMLFKVKQHQQKTNTNEKPKFEKSELLKDSEHVSTWIVRKYGKKDVNTIDKIYVHRVTKDEFQTNLPMWLNQYIACNGAIE
eukprot:224110_1